MPDILIKINDFNYVSVDRVKREVRSILQFSNRMTRTAVGGRHEPVHVNCYVCNAWKRYDRLKAQMEKTLRGKL